MYCWQYLLSLLLEPATLGIQPSPECQLHNCEFTDDITPAVHLQDDIQHNLNEPVAKVAPTGLQINVVKTKVCQLEL